MRSEAQLRQAFNATFDALPSVVRSKIEHLWRTNKTPNESADNTGRFVPPVIKDAIILYRNVRPTPPPFRDGPMSTMSRMLKEAEHAGEVLQQSRGIWGQTDGLVFRFKTAIVDQAPDNLLKALMAHELAHAYRAAEAGCPFPQASLVLGTTEAQEEDAANELMVEWGFDRHALLRWLAESAERPRL
jgi:hypothetical protein